MLDPRETSLQHPGLWPLPGRGEKESRRGSRMMGGGVRPHCCTGEQDLHPTARREPGQCQPWGGCGDIGVQEEKKDEEFNRETQEGGRFRIWKITALGFSADESGAGCLDNSCLPPLLINLIYTNAP